MPNKHKFSKLKTKLLATGKLNANKNVKDTLKHLEQKARVDNEDVNYNFEKDAGKHFDKLEDGERTNRKIKKLNAAKPFGFESNKKRKNEQTSLESKPAKKAKIEPENNNKKEDVVAKKSKKNKYFFLAHPELIQDKQEISNEKFVINEEKMKLNELKKKKKTADVSQKKTKKAKNNADKTNKPKLTTKNNNLWVIDACTSSDDDDDNNEKKAKNEEETNQVLDLDDIEKNFEIKEVEETLEDGTVIKVFKPVIVDNHNEDEQSDEDNKSGVDQENEEEEVAAQEEPNKASDGNKLMEKLKSSRFRYLNEVFYTQSSDKSCEYFQNDEDAFKAYHEGFRSQAVKWPINPLDEIIKYIKSRSPNLIVADFGCGEARLAQQVPNKVHSFDFVALNDLVTKCDMKNVPLNSQSCDLVVFCLSLMGINVVDFLSEAHRVLKNKGVLKIAEVVSRIEDRNKFIRDVESMGFKHLTDPKNKDDPQSRAYFYFFDFIKISPNIKSKPNIKLAACLYKKR